MDLSKNKIKYSLLFVLFSFSACSACSLEEDYLTKANNYYKSYVVDKDKHDLENAYYYFYKASLTTPSAKSFLGMGRVFIEKEMYDKAKVYLYKAYNIDKNDAMVNYYIGCYYFKKEEYTKALSFFVRAKELGVLDGFDINYKMATIYEKVGDFELAKEFYAKAQKFNTEDDFFAPKAQNLDSLDTNKILYFNDWD